MSCVCHVLANALGRGLGARKLSLRPPRDTHLPYVCTGNLSHSNTHPDISQVTRHQGGVEALFRNSMATKGVVVEQPVIPTAIELSHAKADLEDPKAYPVKVPFLIFRPPPR